MARVPPESRYLKDTTNWPSFYCADGLFTDAGRCTRRCDAGSPVERGFAVPGVIQITLYLHNVTLAAAAMARIIYLAAIGASSRAHFLTRSFLLETIVRVNPVPLL